MPLLGGYVFLLLLNKNHLHYAVNILCKFYKTNILGFYLGTTPLVVMNDGVKVKKALLQREFDGKPDLTVARLREPNMNLLGKCNVSLSLLKSHAIPSQAFSSRRASIGSTRDALRCGI